MVAAMLIAAVGILLDQPILIVGAMVVGPEFGPLAGLCVALVNAAGSGWRKRSLAALAVGFPVGIARGAPHHAVLIAVGAFPEDFADARAPAHGLHLEPGLPQLLRGVRGRLGGRPVAHLGQVGRADRAC